jgi:hypothetical protein
MCDVCGNALDRLAGLGDHEMERGREESWVESMSPMSSSQSPAATDDLGSFSKLLLGDTLGIVCGDADIHNTTMPVLPRFRSRRDEVIRYRMGVDTRSQPKCPHGPPSLFVWHE